MSEYEKKLRRIDSVFPDLKVNYAKLDLPEAVEDGYFGVAAGFQPAGGPAERDRPYTVGSFQRRSIRSIVERTIPRVHTEALVVLPNDPNELTHAILAALFKPEVAQQKIEAARQTISKFHPRQRLRALQQMLTTAKR